MESLTTKLPLRFKLLLTSAVCVFVLTLVYTILFVLKVNIGAGNLEPIDFVMRFVIATPFLVNSYILIFWLHRYYPAREITKAFRLVYIITLILTGLEQLGVYFMTILEIVDTPFRRYLHQISTSPVELAFFSLLFFQLYNNIEGLSLLSAIRRNRRNQLMESI